MGSLQAVSKLPPGDCPFIFALLIANKNVKQGLGDR